MKTLSLRLFVLVLFIPCFFTNCNGQKEEEKNYRSSKEIFRAQSFLTFTCKAEDIEFFSTHEGNPFLNFENLKTHLESQKKELIFATNGGMYTPASTPVGLYIENGVQTKSLVTSNGKGNFHLMPNGVFYIDTEGKAGVLETMAYASAKIEAKYATQSGPLLLINGKIHPKFNDGSPNKYVRSGIGITATGEVVMVISEKPVNFYTFALFFKEKFGCKDALYLDGAISKMYLPEQGRMDIRGKFSSIIAVTEPQ